MDKRGRGVPWPHTGRTHDLFLLTCRTVTVTQLHHCDMLSGPSGGSSHLDHYNNYWLIVGLKTVIRKWILFRPVVMEHKNTMQHKQATTAVHTKPAKTQQMVVGVYLCFSIFLYFSRLVCMFWLQGLLLSSHLALKCYRHNHSMHARTPQYLGKSVNKKTLKKQSKKTSRL